MDDEEICKSVGLSVEDGLVFTVCGGQLIGRDDSPDWIIEMNGWTTHEASEAIRNQKEKE